MYTIEDTQPGVVDDRACAAQAPQLRSIDEARRVEKIHSGHDLRHCHQHLAAVAYSGGALADDDWDGE